MRGFAIVLALVALSGCVMSFTVLDAELPKYYGRHIDTLVARIGYPNSEQMLMGRKVYVWTTSMQHVSVTPTTSTSSGYVGTMPVTITGTNYQTNVIQLSCTIRVFVDDANIIQFADYGGNNGACYTYSEPLEK